MKGFFFANFEDIAGKLFRVFMDLSNNQSVDFDQESWREKSQSLKCKIKILELLNLFLVVVFLLFFALYLLRIFLTV